jgi:hypothetical protein
LTGDAATHWGFVANEKGIDKMKVTPMYGFMGKCTVL